MYERLLEKNAVPTKEFLTYYCGINKERFIRFNDYLTEKLETEESIRFPYGKSYGWCITHRHRKKLICDVFAESDAFTVMIRLPNKDFDALYGRLHQSAEECIDNKYPCSDGGWIHFRILNDEDLADAILLVSRK